ncbi:response regulator [bacterium]|nr:response regulator [bacterium]
MSNPDKLRILVVEDEPLVRESIVAFLETLGYIVSGIAENGEEAIEKTKALLPNLVFMDIKMPGIDGIEAAKRIQEFSEIPVVLLTAYESEELVRQASEAGVSSYLMKPPTTAEIHRAVTIAMARHRDFMKMKMLNLELGARTAELEKALEEIQTLRGILPICAGCKNIRNDEGFWEKVEDYLERNSSVSFTHGLCPDCQTKLYGDFLKDNTDS